MKPGEKIYMTDDQEKHLGHLKDKFLTMADLKYRRGVLEHGGNLWEMDKYDLIDNAIDEVLDQWMYLVSLREKL